MRKTFRIHCPINVSYNLVSVCILCSMPDFTNVCIVALRLCRSRTLLLMFEPSSKVAAECLRMVDCVEVISLRVVRCCSSPSRFKKAEAGRLCLFLISLWTIEGRRVSSQDIVRRTRFTCSISWGRGRFLTVVFPWSKSWTLKLLARVSRLLSICFLKSSCFLDSRSKAILFSLSICFRTSERSSSCFAFLSIAFFISAVGWRYLFSWSFMAMR